MNTFPAVARLSTMIAVALVVAACQTTSMNRTDTLTTLENDVSVIVMPADVQLVELTAGGLEEPNAQWTADATGYIHDSLKSSFDDLGLTYQVLNLDALSEQERLKEEELGKLHRAVGSSIIVHRFLQVIQMRGSVLVQPRLPVMGNDFDFSLGDQVSVIREHSGADYALFLFVKDQYSSAGRVALNVVAALLGAPVRGGTQVGYASLVDLRSGELVWFNLLARQTGDLRKAETAPETVAELLSNFPSKTTTAQ